MADEKPQAEEKAKEAAEAGVQAAQAVEEHKEQVESAAASAVADANAQAEEARRAAAAVAQGAMQQENRVAFESFRGDVDKWRTEQTQTVESLRGQLAQTQEQLGELKAGVGLILGALKPASPSPSTPPKSDDQPEAPKQPANPEGAKEGDHAPAHPQPTRKKHFL